MKMRALLILVILLTTTTALAEPRLVFEPATAYNTAGDSTFSNTVTYPIIHKLPGDLDSDGDCDGEDLKKFSVDYGNKL